MGNDKAKITTRKVQRMEPIHYAQRYGEFCPYCRQAAVLSSGEPLGASRHRITWPMMCKECGARWHDVHILTGYLPDTLGDEE